MSVPQILLVIVWAITIPLLIWIEWCVRTNHWPSPLWGYKPTLGGLKRAQEYLASKGHPLPVFQVNIYEGGVKHNLFEGEDVGVDTAWWSTGPGHTVSIDEEIEKHGFVHEVVDVRLKESEESLKEIRFAAHERVPFFTQVIAKENGWGCVPMGNEDIWKKRMFEEFVNSKEGGVFFDLARWGKTRPTFFDQIQFHLCRKRYARRVFLEHQAF